MERNTNLRMWQLQANIEKRTCEMHDVLIQIHSQIQRHAQMQTL